MLVFFTNLSPLKFQVRYCALFLLFSVRLEIKLELLEASILDPTFFLLFINDLSDGVICNIVIYPDDTTCQSKCDQVSDLWQQLEFVSELESDLRDTLGWGRKWPVDLNAEKTWLVSVDGFNDTGAIDVKMDGSGLQEKSSFKMPGLTFYSKLDWEFYIISIPKTGSKKIGALIRSMKFFSPEVALYFYNFIIRPCMEYWCHVCAGAPRNCQISYKNGY